MALTDAQRQYAAGWLRRFVAPEIDTRIIPEDLLILIFRELSRQEESEEEIRDQWGNWEWPYSQANREGLLYVPRVDIAVQNWAKAISSSNGFPLWPDNKPFAICLTHDVDLISRRSTSLRFIGELARRFMKVRSGSFKQSTSQLLRHMARYLSMPILRFQQKDEYHCFDKCMELEAKFGFKSTFFFFAEHLPTPHIWDCGYSHADKVEFYGLRMTVRAMIREMLQRGWDIGLHGSYHSATDLSALKEEKRQMEESAGATVQAIRHHYLHYDVRVTPSLHEQAGLKADSTQGFNRNIGFRAGTSFPYYCWSHQDQRSTNVLELPLHVMDGSLLSAQGLDCDINMATTKMKMMMDRIAAMGGCLTLNWHPSWLSLKPYYAAYEWTLREAQERNAWGCTVQSLLRWVDEQTEEGIWTVFQP